MLIQNRAWCALLAAALKVRAPLSDKSAPLARNGRKRGEWWTYCLLYLFCCAGLAWALGTAAIARHLSMHPGSMEGRILSRAHLRVLNSSSHHRCRRPYHLLTHPSRRQLPHSLPENFIVSASFVNVVVSVSVTMPPVEFPRAEYAVRRCPVFCSIKLRPSPLSLGTSNYLKAPTPAPSGLSRQDPPNPPPTPHRWEIDDSDDFSRQDPPTPPRNPPPTPRRRQFSIAKDDGWSFEETGNLVLACRSGVSMVSPLHQPV